MVRSETGKQNFVWPEPAAQIESLRRGTIRKQLSAIAVVVVGFGMLALPGFAQQRKKPRKPLSPPAAAGCWFSDGNTIKVN